MSVILVVDDSAADRRLVGGILEKSPEFSVRYAKNGAEALSLMDQSRPDLVLTDMMMPEIDGYEAIPKIRKIKGKEHVPIIAVTAQAMTGDKEKCIAAGATDYISKPIDVDKLLSILNEHVK